MTRDLPPWVQDILANPPRAGEGVHGWLFRAARQLHAHLPAGEIVALLESRAANCGRCVPPSEIISAVQNSVACAWQPRGQLLPTHAVPKWPAVNQEQREAVIRDGGGLADLWELSPIRIEDNRAHTEEIIARLFPPDSLLCCGKSNREFDTKPRDDWRGELAQLQFIVPSPMSAVEGVTKEGKPSKHAAGHWERQQIVQDLADDGHGALNRAWRALP